MDESKLKRIVGASVVTAVILVVLLSAVLIYQLLAISTQRKKIRELETQISAYEQLNDEARSSIEGRSQKWWIIQRARELGYKFADDSILN